MCPIYSNKAWLSKDLWPPHILCFILVYNVILHFNYQCAKVGPLAWR